MDNIYIDRYIDGSLHIFLKRYGFTVKGGKGWAEDILAEYVWLGSINSERTHFCPNTGRKNPHRNSSMLLPLCITEFIDCDKLYALIKGD